MGDDSMNHRVGIEAEGLALKGEGLNGERRGVHRVDTVLGTRGMARLADELHVLMKGGRPVHRAEPAADMNHHRHVHVVKSAFTNHRGLPRNRLDLPFPNQLGAVFAFNPLLRGDSHEDD